jgi:raffinose/stachyose/melibiose transport system substrate-binding protein
MERRFTRRLALAFGATATLGTALAACQSQAPTPPATPVVVTQVVTQVVEKQVPVTQVVERQVQVTQVVTQVVQQQVVVTATALPEAKLEFWNGKPEMHPGLVNLGKIFKSRYPNITFNPTQFPIDAFGEKIKVAVASGSAPDLWEDQTRPVLDERSKTGWFLDLTGKVDAKLMVELAQNILTVNGKLWGVAVGTYQVGHEYNVDIFKQYDLKPPTTWEEQNNVMATLKKAGVTPESNSVKNLLYWNVLGNVASVLGNAGFVDLTTGNRKLTEAPLVAGIQQIVDMFDNGYFQKGVLGASYEESRSLAIVGKAAWVVSGPDLFTLAKQQNPKINLDWFPFAAGPGGKPATAGGTDPNWFANAKTKHPEEAATFLDWMVHPEGQQAQIDFIGLLPSITGMKVDDPVKQHILETPEVTPAWYQNPITIAADNVSDDLPDLLAHKLSPADYMAKTQKKIDEAIAKQKG